MEKTFKARFTNGTLEPLEQLTLNEGEEVMVTITSIAGMGVAQEMASDESFRRGAEEGFRQRAEGRFSRLDDVKRRLGDV